MGIRFESPWFLLLLLPLASFLFLSLRTPASRGKLRKSLSLTLRVVIILCLIASVAGLQWVTTIRERAVYYVVDRSDSMPDSGGYRDFLQQSSAAKKAKDTVGVIATGLHALVERSLSVEPLSGTTFNSRVNSAFTNVAGGLQLAAGLLPQEADARIVLLTDGEENVGDMMRQGRLLKDRGIRLDILPLPREVAADVAIDSLKLPGALYQAEKYTAEVTLTSTIAATGQLRLYEDNRQIADLAVQVEKGENRFAVPGLAKESGLHRYRAEIYFPEDEQSINNTGYAFSRVSGPPRVLVVEGTPDTSLNLVNVLKSGLIGHEVIPPELLSRELADYASYDSLILNNVSAVRLAGPVMATIEQAVRDYGMGLMMTGGEDSYGMGGYFGTPIEKALPVRMELEGKREIPPLALILVIDRSGSMSDGKLELAKESAMRTVELLRPQDTIGVLAFDDTRWWVVEPTKLTDKNQVINQIQSLQPNGGTDIYPATAEAYYKLKDNQATRKHIILLTDGQSAGNGSYEQLTSEMTAAQITMSTVAIGNDSDQQLLEKLANLAKGRYYFTDDQSTLPAIFSRETVLLSRSYIVDKPFVPLLGQAGDWHSLFADGAPVVNAYVAATAKETAEVSLLSPEPDPLLARWQYGSGRSVAWTSDISGKWAPDWTNWAEFPEVFSRVLKWTFPQFEATPYELTAETTSGQTRLTLSSPETAEASGDMTLVITGDDLKEQRIAAVPTAPGQYRADLGHMAPGAYLTRVEHTNAAGEKQSAAATGFVVAYSPEYRLAAQPEPEKLQQLAELTGGRLLKADEPEAVFAGDTRATRREQDLSRALAIAALLLWPFDIAARRLSLPWHRLAAWLSSVMRRMFGAPGLAGEATGAAGADAGGAGAGSNGASGSVERLGQRKRQVAAFYGAANGGAGASASGAKQASQAHSSGSERGRQAAASASDGRAPGGGAADAAAGAPQQASQRQAADLAAGMAAARRSARSARDSEAADRVARPGAAPTVAGPSSSAPSGSTPKAGKKGGSKPVDAANDDETLNRLLAAKNRKR